MKRRAVALGILLACLWTLFIWSNSLKPVEQSAAQSERVLETVEPILEKVPERLITTSLHNFVRKTAHAVEFAVLGGLWMGTLALRGRSRGRTAALALGLCAVTAACDEAIQLFVPGRGGQLRDVALDVCGAAAAIGLFLLLWLAASRLRRRKGRA